MGVEASLVYQTFGFSEQNYELLSAFMKGFCTTFDTQKALDNNF